LEVGLSQPRQIGVDGHGRIEKSVGFIKYSKYIHFIHLNINLLLQMTVQSLCFFKHSEHLGCRELQGE